MKPQRHQIVGLITNKIITENKRQMKLASMDWKLFFAKETQFPTWLFGVKH